MQTAGPVPLETNSMCKIFVGSLNYFLRPSRYTCFGVLTRPHRVRPLCLPVVKIDNKMAASSTSDVPAGMRINAYGDLEPLELGIEEWDKRWEKNNIGFHSHSVRE